MSEYYDLGEPHKAANESPQSSQDEFFGFGWSVYKSDGKFYLDYISGELAGRAKVIEISENDYDQSKLGVIRLNDLCIKYDIF